MAHMYYVEIPVMLTIEDDEIVIVSTHEEIMAEIEKEIDDRDSALYERINQTLDQEWIDEMRENLGDGIVNVILERRRIEQERNKHAS